MELFRWVYSLRLSMLCLKSQKHACEGSVFKCCLVIQKPVSLTRHPGFPAALCRLITKEVIVFCSLDQLDFVTAAKILLVLLFFQQFDPLGYLHIDSRVFCSSHHQCMPSHGLAQGVWDAGKLGKRCNVSQEYQNSRLKNICLGNFKRQN